MTAAPVYASVRSVVGAVFLAVFVLGCGKGGGGPDAGVARVTSVTIAPATVKDVPLYLDGLGSVAAYMTVTVKAQVDGRLESVAFKEGQLVKKGEVLAQIDPRPYLAVMHQAEGALARDTSQLASAKLDLQRYEKLVDQKLIPPQQYDQQKALVGQDEGLVQMDRGTLESAQLNVSYARIIAPVDGVTGIRQIDPGNLVHAADQNGIVLLTTLEPVAVVFTLPQDELPRIAQAEQARSLTVDVFNRAGDQKLGSGQLSLVDNQINQTTGTLRLKAIFSNPDHLLWPNEFVKARLYLDIRKDALVIPTPAVQRGPNGTFVYVVKGDEAQPRDIQVELAADDAAVVRSGLKPGEDVVVEGQNMLKPGAKVQAHKAGESASPGAGAAAAKGRP